MTARSFDDVQRALQGYIPLAHGQRKAYTLYTMQQLMDQLGNPQETFRTVHVAGTSGKTSTSYYIASFLSSSGKKVGLTVSPHVEQINERLQINLEPLAEAAYCRYFNEFMHIVEDLKINPSYFELLVAFAYWVFAKERVDFAVVEVGLGGLLDATNVISRPDKVCVITDIGHDHTEVLGKTLAEIVAQKAGIIHPNNTVVCYDQGDEVMSVIREVASQEQAELHEVWPLSPKELPRQLPVFQRRNWYLALSVYRCISEKYGFALCDEQQLAESTKLIVPGRMEIVTMGDKTVVMDGAHNAQKMIALTDSFKERFPRHKPVVVLGLVRSNNFRLRTRLQSIIDLGGHIIITSFEHAQDVRRSAVDPAKIAEYIHVQGYDDWEIIADPIEAFKGALERSENLILVTGSFFLIDEIRPYVMSKRA